MKIFTAILNDGPILIGLLLVLASVHDPMHWLSALLG